MAAYRVRVQKGKSRGYSKERLYRFGLLSDGTDSYFGELHDIHETEKLRRYCKQMGLHLVIEGRYSERNAHYRRDFFQKNKPVLGSRYFCAYCGKLLKKPAVTIDHIYPVAKTRESALLQAQMRRAGISSVNDPANLVACCKNCNREKGKKLGSAWLIKAAIGRHPHLWILRWIIRYALVGSVLYFAISFIINTIRL